MTVIRNVFVGGLTVGMVTALVAGSAAAAPAKGDHFSLTCGSTTYQVVAMGNGEFTPAHDLDGHLVFVPHAFQGFTGIVYDTEGNLVDTFTDNTVTTQGSGKQKNDVSCTYRFEQVSDGSNPDEPPAGYRFVGIGGVTGQVAGHA